MSEEQETCIFCSTKDLVRVPQMPHISREIKSEGGKAGDKVKAAIEENRAILDEAKKEARNLVYKDKK
jgi:vacuolar-type H+-ATPase subunit H